MKEANAKAILPERKSAFLRLKQVERLAPETLRHDTTGTTFLRKKSLSSHTLTYSNRDSQRIGESSRNGSPTISNYKTRQKSNSSLRDLDGSALNGGVAGSNHQTRRRSSSLIEDLDEPAHSVATAESNYRIRRNSSSFVQETQVPEAAAGNTSSRQNPTQISNGESSSRLGKRSTSAKKDMQQSSSHVHPSSSCRQNGSNASDMEEQCKKQPLHRSSYLRQKGRSHDRVKESASSRMLQHYRASTFGALRPWTIKIWHGQEEAVVLDNNSR